MVELLERVMAASMDVTLVVAMAVHSVALLVA